MRVHIHTPSYLPDLVGMSYAADGHAAIFTELGWHVTIMVANVPLGEEIAGHGRRWRAIGSGLSGSGLPWSPLRGDLGGLMAFTEAGKADLILIEGWYTSAAALIPLFKSLNLRVALASHGAADAKLKFISASLSFRALCYRVAEHVWIPKLARQLDAVLILSEYMDKERFADISLYRELGLQAYVCPNFSEYEPRTDLRKLSERPTLIHIGEMLPHKNQLMGVQALSNLPKNFRLILAYPKITDYGNMVKTAIRNLGLEAQVDHVVGRARHELEAIVDSADCLAILTHSKDVQPIVAVDAMIKRIPFVSTRVGCMPEFAGGVLCENSPISFAQAVLQVLGSPERYEAFSTEAFQYANSQLSKVRAKLSIAEMARNL